MFSANTCAAIVAAWARIASRWTASANAETSVQLRKTLLKRHDILRISRLQLTVAGLIDVRDLAGLDGFQQAHQPVTLFVPILRAHDSLNLPQRPKRPEPLPPNVIFHNVSL